jgi:hypothetical protein
MPPCDADGLSRGGVPHFQTMVRRVLAIHEQYQMVAPGRREFDDHVVERDPVRLQWIRVVNRFRPVMRPRCVAGRIAQLQPELIDAVRVGQVRVDRKSESGREKAQADTAKWPISKCSCVLESS